MKRNLQSFQRGSFGRLQRRARIISIWCGLSLFLVACCPPATTSSSQETAFTATFLGFSSDGKYLLVKPERSSANVQIVYANTENLVVGQRVYVVGRLEGDLVYVNDLRPL